MPEKPICLIERSRIPEASARVTIARLYGPIVYRWIRRWGVPREDAAQVTRRAFRSLFKRIDSWQFASSGYSFRDAIWAQSRYHAAENHAINSMAIPERYSVDVNGGLIADDTARLLRGAGHLLIQRVPAEQKPVIHHVIEQQRSPTAAASQLPFSLREIRELKNKFLRRLHAEFGLAIGLPESTA